MTVTEWAALIGEAGALAIIAALFLMRTASLNKANDKKFDLMFDKLTGLDHTAESEDDIVKIEEEITDILNRLMNGTSSDRAFLIRYHNGGKDLNLMSFLKMSMTNEVMRPGFPSMMANFTNQFRSLFQTELRTLTKNGVDHYIVGSDEKRLDCTPMFGDFLRQRGVTSFHACTITDKNERVVGILGIEYFNEERTKPKKEIEKCLRDKKLKIETAISIMEKQK